MKERVRGRIKVQVGADTYRIELMQSGIYVRRHKTRHRYILTPDQIVKLCHKQLDMFEAGRV